MRADELDEQSGEYVWVKDPAKAYYPAKVLSKDKRTCSIVVLYSIDYHYYFIVTALYCCYYY